MPQYRVTMPIAGHAYYSVEAESEEQAIRNVMLMDIAADDYEWEPMVDGFNDGNICYCPEPWNPEAELIEDEPEATNGN